MSSTKSLLFHEYSGRLQARWGVFMIDGFDVFIQSLVFPLSV